MRWWTSDQHYGHRSVIRTCNRPFQPNFLYRFWTKLTGKVSKRAVRIMNEEMIRRHNEVVAPNDIVMHLGDFSMTPNVMKTILPRLNGIHHLVMGNHDRCHPCHGKSKSIRNIQLYKDAGFQEVHQELIMTVAGFTVRVNHMPYLNPQTAIYDQRYAQYRPKDDHMMLLHGHVHTKWKVLRQMVNVGVDQWNFYPVSETQIGLLLEEILLDAQIESLRN